MAGIVLLPKGSLLKTILGIYLVVWEGSPISVLGLCSMTIQSKRGVQKEGTAQEDMHKSRLILAEKPTSSVNKWKGGRLAAEILQSRCQKFIDSEVFNFNL